MTKKQKNCPSGYFQPKRSLKQKLKFARKLCQKGNNPQSNAQLGQIRPLIAGFCCKFSTLASDCSKLPDKQNRKAVFLAVWMKFLSNFRSGKSSQERLIVERFFIGQHFNIEVVHAVISRELVYTCVHSHIQGRKMSDGTLDTRTFIKVQYCGLSKYLDRILFV